MDWNCLSRKIDRLHVAIEHATSERQRRRLLRLLRATEAKIPLKSQHRGRRPPCSRTR